jgi:hypothetical protein
LRTPLTPVLWLLAAFTLASCGGPSSSGPRTSGIPYRAFVSNAVTASTIAGLYIVNAETDVRPLNVAPITAGTTPGMMVVTPDRRQTLVVTTANNCSNEPANTPCQFSIISNAGESNAANVTLPGFSQSVVVSPDSSTAYVAVPSAKVVNSPVGAIELYSLTGITPGASAGEVDIPAVQYLAIDNAGDRILAFSPNGPNPSSVAVVTPSNLGTSSPVVTYVSLATDSLAPNPIPVQAFFSSDDSTAYIINCGPECGGTQASVQTLDMTTSTPTAGTSTVSCNNPGGRCLGTVNLPAGSAGFLNGTTLYVAGTPYNTSGESFTCTGAEGETLNCGTLSIVDLTTLAPPPAPAAITDGYHNQMALGPNNQLFIGAQNCTEIIPPVPPPTGAEVRGCLSIYNALPAADGSVPAGGVVIPPENGNVTGIAPIANRDVVYVVQGYPTPGGSLYIYCTVVDVSSDNFCPTADALQTPPYPVNPTYAPLMVGNFYDVVTVDF